MVDNSAEAEGVVPTDSQEGVEASQVWQLTTHRMKISKGQIHF